MKNNKEILQSIIDWFDENENHGKDLGYPQCCIDEFCMQPKVVLELKLTEDTDRLRYKAGCIDGKFSGFIPCINHANQINNGQIKLNDLIENRNPTFLPFPKEPYYEE